MEDMILMVPEEQMVPALDVALRSTPSRWWATHKDNPESWEKVQRALRHYFNQPPEYQVIDIPGAVEDRLS
ncbi:hypothetical protein SUGI_1222700 [Cryptomeria japonica]|jgi:hypothetical protein|uniref:Uncharacterized protein n=1 Tax=Cryptomeria japonica TaxID=3369 RepID=A0AAD3NPL3_CRYJA|nr:hypothetical protein SUGI_1222700 [Cryptomeria japonica]